MIDVLVVGAGPVGLFCANELTRHGINCRIIDKKKALTEHSKAIALHIRTLELLEDCDFIHDILDEGHKIYGALFKSNDTLLSEINFTNLSSNYDFLINLPQNQTEHIFYQKLVEKQIPVEWQSELIAFKEGTPVIAYVKNPDDQIEEIQAQWIIACDGAHSTLRELCHANFVGSDDEQSWWLADLMIDWEVPQNKMIFYVSPHGPLACFPLGENRYRLVMAAPDEPPNFEGIFNIFNDRSSDQAKLSEPTWMTKFSIHYKQIEHYQYKHVFFCGDAAHIHSPMGGQGLNTGIQDVYNLVWKLSLVLKGLAKPSLLASYHAERYPIAKAVLKKTDMMTKMVSIKNKSLIHLRNKLISALSSHDLITAPMAKDLAELNISYAKSPIVKMEGKTRFKLGEYLPSVILKSFKARHTVLLEKLCQGTLHHVFLLLRAKQMSSALDKELVELEKKYHALFKLHLIVLDSLQVHSTLESIWLDENFMIQNRFDITDSACVVVRPDKYIGYIVAPFNLEALNTWLNEWFTV